MHQEEDELNFVLDGAGTYVVNGHSRPVKKNDILYIQHDVLHSCFSSSQNLLDILSINFRCPEYLPGISCCTQNAGSYSEYVRQSFIAIYQLGQKRTEDAEGIAQGILHSLLLLLHPFFSKNEAFYSENPSKSCANEIQQYISEHYAEPISLASLADRFHISASHVSYVFSRSFGISPINYLIDVRFYRAKEMITSSSLTLAQIAERVGYTNYNHFNQLFYKRHGITPAEFREKNLNREVLPTSE
ncbi:MAG: helix-turn-helix domain-containing protein [Lachnospiraceae bacterium]|nr:helix-turn-helix domain-containing protein [Lachnospiraceae bacterium]